MKNIIANIDKTFENRVRLGVMSVLMVNERVDFNTLKEMLDVTDGNLASHLRALKKNGFVEVRKQFIRKKPNTSYKATDKGKDAFKQHLEAIERLITETNK